MASAAAYADQAKRAAMEDIALLLRGAIQARGNVLLKLNVPADKLPAVTEMLPALSSPTILSLARGNMNAVETVVPKRGVNTLIPALKAAARTSWKSPSPRSWSNPGLSGLAPLSLLHR